jgi:diaminopimelate decarboxylase
LNVIPGGDAVNVAAVLPDTATIGPAGRLAIGGCDLVDLAAAQGTPLYVYDEATIRQRSRSFTDALARGYPAAGLVCYAAKAFCAPWLLRMLAELGLGLDVVSGGELHAAAAVRFPRERIFVHGNNKSEEELSLALEERAGRIVVDNLDEVSLLGRVASARGLRQGVLLRVAPAVEVDTHVHLHTGASDTKFGLGIDTGQAEEAVRAILAEPSLELLGFHAHVGSQIREIGPYEETVDRLLRFAADMRTRFGLDPREFSPGGGFGVRYTPDEEPVSVPALIERVGEIVAAACRRNGFGSELPRLTIEPGRSLIASSAVALYRVGSVKAVPGGRTFVAVDGGMADNIRPSLYGAAYTAVLANRAADVPDAEVAVVGRYCESGDVLIERVRLPRPRVGDLIAVPAAGAYQLSMAGNYNMFPRPAVAAVSGGRARLVRRRETYQDLLANEILPHAGPV